MDKKITTILFDLDGTLMDTRDSIYEGMVHGFSVSGLEAPTAEEFRENIGITFENLIKNITGSEEHSEKIRNAAREHQIANMHLVKLYPGVKNVLVELKKRGYKLGAVTNANSVGTRRRLEHVGILDLFDTVIGAETAKNPKPYPDPVLLALKNVDSAPDEAMMVGDLHIDIEAGKSAGTKTVRVTYGFHTEEMNNPKPDYFIDKIEDLLKIL